MIISKSEHIHSADYSSEAIKSQLEFILTFKMEELLKA